MPGLGMLGGTAMSVAVHGGLAAIILLVLGYPFLMAPPPEPQQVEIVVEKPPEPEESLYRPPAEPTRQAPSTPVPAAPPGKAMERLARSLSDVRDRPAVRPDPVRTAATPAPPRDAPAPAPVRPAVAQPVPAPDTALPPGPPVADPAGTEAPAQKRPTPAPAAPPQARPPVPASTDRAAGRAPPLSPDTADATVPPAARQPAAAEKKPDLPAPGEAAPQATSPRLAATDANRSAEPAPAPRPEALADTRQNAGTAPRRVTPPTVQRAPAPQPQRAPATERSLPDQTVPEQAAPEQAAPGQTVPEQTVPDRAFAQQPAPERPAAAAATRPPSAPARLPPEVAPANQLAALAALKRQAARQDLAALQAAASQAHRSATDAAALLQVLAPQLQELLAASAAPWAREQVQAAQANARSLTEAAARDAALAAAAAAAARALADGLDSGASAPAVVRRADAIAIARSRVEEAARAARDSHARLQQQVAALPESARPDAQGARPAPAVMPTMPDFSPTPALPTPALPTRAALPAVAMPQGRPEMLSADGAAGAPPGATEAALQRGGAQTEAIVWLGDRIQRLIARVQGEPAGLASPDARVAMRALEMRGQNLAASAATLTAALREAEETMRVARSKGLPTPIPAAELTDRIERANAAFVANARSVAEALDPVIARMPREEAQWAKVMRSSLDWLVERRRLDGRPGSEAAPPPPPVPTPQQRQVLRAAREADPILPRIVPHLPPPAPEPAEAQRRDPTDAQALQAALNAARMHQIAGAGTPSALYNLANALLNADGMQRDPSRAAALLKTLAEQGYRPAQVRYAEIAMLGDGRPADAAEALAWYRIAAINGSTAGQKAGAAMALELTPEVRAAAESIVAQWLAMQGPDVKPGQDELDRSLATAIEKQNYGEVERLLQRGANPQALDDHGRTAIVGAAWRGRSSIVRLLVEHGVLTDVRDAEQRSALLWASINGYSKIADDLLDFGAEVDIRDSEGATPLIRAAWNRKYAVVERLLAAGADTGMRDGEGRTAADRAGAEGDSRMVRMLGGKPPRP